MIKHEEIKSTVKNFIDEHGAIKRIKGNDSILGFLLRKELKNESLFAEIAISIPIKAEYENKLSRSISKEPKTFPVHDIKYFGISHLNNVNLNKYDKILLNNSENNEFIKKYVNNKLLNIIELNIEKEQEDYESIKKLLENSIKNVIKYYKNKSIYVYLI